VLPCLEIAALDAATELLLLVGGEERDLVDLVQVGLETAFGGDGGPPGSRGVLRTRRPPPSTARERVLEEPRGFEAGIGRCGGPCLPFRRATAGRLLHGRYDLLRGSRELQRRSRQWTAPDQDESGASKSRRSPCLRPGRGHLEPPGQAGPAEPDGDGGAGDDVVVTGVHSLKNGLLFAGTTGASNAPFSGGMLCVAPR